MKLIISSAIIGLILGALGYGLITLWIYNIPFRVIFTITIILIILGGKENVN